MQYFQKSMGKKLVFCLQIKAKELYKLIASFSMCKARHDQKNKFTTSSRNLKENAEDESDFLPLYKCQRFLQIDTIILGVWPGMSKLPKIASLLFLCILRKKWVMKLIFYRQISMKASFSLMLWFWWELSSIPKVSKTARFQCLYYMSNKRTVLYEVLQLQVVTNSLRIP